MLWTKQEIEGPWLVMFFDLTWKKFPNRDEANKFVRQYMDQWMEAKDKLSWFPGKCRGIDCAQALVVSPFGDTDAFAQLFPLNGEVEQMFSEIKGEGDVYPVKWKEAEL